MKTLASLLRLFCLGALALPLAGRALDQTDRLPGSGYTISRYDILWNDSPFTVATPDANPVQSAEYALVGVCRFKNISYATLIDKKSQEHFLLFGDKPQRGLRLVAINPATASSAATAVILRNGESLTLRLESPPAGPAAAGAGGPPVATQQIAMPGSPEALRDAEAPPSVHLRRHIRLQPQTTQPSTPSP